MAEAIMPELSEASQAARKTSTQWFILNAGAILALTGVAKVWSGLGNSKFLALVDPIIGIKFGQLMLGVGVAEIAIALVCFCSKRQTLALGLVAWMSTNFVVYRLGLWWIDWHRPCNCLGNLTDALHLSPQTADNIMKVLLAYLLIGSYGLLLWQWLSNRSTKSKTEIRFGKKTKMPVYGIMAMLLVVCGVSASAANGFEAMGYLTYTTFNALGDATYKNVMMFNVKAGANTWRIRTEPVIERAGGIGYYEAALSTNDDILMVTALESAYKNSESPFQSLRTELKESRREDVYFATSRPRIPPTFSNIVSGAVLSGTTSVPSEKTVSNHANNVAIADTLQGKYPRVDSSYVAFLSFAFTPPNAQIDGSNKLLLQIWDDGNRNKTRLRRARWNQFAESPHLVSNAIYSWAGKQILPNGNLDDISTSDVSKPLEIAARYEVDLATNFSSMMVPLHFKLARFHTDRPEGKEPKVVSTVVAKVTEISLFNSDEPLEVKVPGKTFVSDYRLSAGELKGSPLAYLIDSNTPPTLEQVQQGNLYKRTAEIANASPSKPYLRLALLAFLLASPVGVFIFWKYTART